MEEISVVVSAGGGGGSRDDEFWVDVLSLSPLGYQGWCLLGKWT